MKTTTDRSLTYGQVFAPAPVTLTQLVATVSGLVANEAETAQVINHLLLCRRIRFVDELDPEEIALLAS